MTKDKAKKIILNNFYVDNKDKMNEILDEMFSIYDLEEAKEESICKLYDDILFKNMPKIN